MTLLDTEVRAPREQHPPPTPPRNRLPVGGGLVLAALATVNVLVPIGYPVAPLAFPVVVLLPGALALVAIGGNRRRGWDWTLHAVAFSLLTLIAVGTVLALLPGPALATGPALLGFDAAVAILGAAAWRRRRNTVPGRVRAHARLAPGRRTSTPRLLVRAWRRGSGTGTGGPGAVLGPRAGVVAVAFAVAGAHHLNAGGPPWIAAAGLAAAVVAFAAAVAAARRQGTVAAAGTVYLAALAVLLATSLRGDVVTGHDIKIEYRVFLDTFDTGSWQPGGRYPGYNSCLSLTVLPSMLAHLLGVAPLDVFRLLYQVIFALVPVGALLVARRLLRPAHAVLAAGLVVAFPTFVNDMPMLNRQEIALLFFVVLLLALIDARPARRHRTTVIALAAAGLTVSHYSSAAIAAAVLLIAATLRLLRLTAGRLTGPRTRPPAAVPQAWSRRPGGVPGEHHLRLRLRRAAPVAGPPADAPPDDPPDAEPSTARTAGLTAGLTAGPSVGPTAGPSVGPTAGPSAGSSGDGLLVGVSARLYRRRTTRDVAPPGLFLAAVATTVAVLAWSAITGSAATFAADLVTTVRAIDAGATVQSDSTRYAPGADKVPVDDATVLNDYAALLVASRADEGAVPPPRTVVPEVLPADELPVTRLGAALDAAGVAPGDVNTTVRRGVVLLFGVGALLGCGLLWWRLRPAARRTAEAPDHETPRAGTAGSVAAGGSGAATGPGTGGELGAAGGPGAARGVVAAQIAATAEHGPVARGRSIVPPPPGTASGGGASANNASGGSASGNRASGDSASGGGASGGGASGGGASGDSIAGEQNGEAGRPAGAAPGVGAGGVGARAWPVWRPAAPVLAELAAAGVLLLGVSLAVPQITDSYGLLRIYQQLLPVLAVAVIVLLVTVARWVFRGGRAAVDVAVTVVVLGCLVTVTGLLPRATGGYPPQLNLASAGPYQRAYLAGPADAAMAAAVGGFLPAGAVVVADSRDAVNLRALAGLAPVEGIVPGAVPADAYLLVQSADGGRLTATAVVGDRVIRYLLPLDAVAAGRTLALATGSHLLYGPVPR